MDKFLENVTKLPYNETESLMVQIHVSKLNFYEKYLRQENFLGQLVLVANSIT